MKFLIILTLFQFYCSSLILKAPRILDDKINKDNDIVTQVNVIESENKNFASDFNRKIQMQMTQDEQVNVQEQEQNPQVKKNNQQKGQKQEQKTNQKNDLQKNKQKNEKLDQEIPDEEDNETPKNDVQKNTTDNQIQDPSEREIKKPFVEKNDMVMFKNQSEDEQNKNSKVQKDILFEHVIDKHLEKNNQKAVAEFGSEQNNEDDKNQKKVELENKKSIQKIEDLTIIKDQEGTQIESQVKTNLNHPDQKKSEEVILSRVSDTKGSNIIQKLLIGFMTIILI